MLMTNKNVYLTIGILVILVVSIAAYAGLSSIPNSVSPSITPTPTTVTSPSLTESSSPTQSIPSTSPLATLSPTLSPSAFPSGSPSSAKVSITVSLGSANMGSIEVDGTSVSSPTIFQWQVGSVHSLQAVSPAAGQTGTQYVWSSWSDGGDQTHSFTVPSSGATITANYKVQYQVTFAQSGLENSANGTVVTTNLGSASYANMPFSLWVDSGTQVSYTYQFNVTTTVPGALYTISEAPSSSSLIVAAPTTVTATYDRAVIDYNGNLIHVPAAAQINRIADSWPAHNTIVVMVGARDKLVATSPTDTTILMFQNIFPPIKTMTAPFDSSGMPNLEQLLATNPDIVFVSASNEAPAKAIENSGMLVVRLNFLNFNDMTKCVQLTGWILGEDALSRANEYVSYFNQVYNNVTSVTSQIPLDQQLSVYHVSGTSPLYCDGNGTLGNSWIIACGGTNAAAPITGNGKQVTFEQVLAWNPDVILIGSAQANQLKSQILNDSRWNEINAVKNGRVVVNPMGVFDWSRYSVEEALNIQWVAKTLYPDKFANIDIRAETSNFYQTFYQYTLSDAQLDAILTNNPPP